MSGRASLSRSYEGEGRGKPPERDGESPPGGRGESRREGASPLRRLLCKTALRHMGEKVKKGEYSFLFVQGTKRKKKAYGRTPSRRRSIQGSAEKKTDFGYGKMRTASSPLVRQCGQGSIKKKREMLGFFLRSPTLPTRTRYFC